MDESDRTLWMGDLDPSWDSNFIGEAFARMGEELQNVKVVLDKYSGKAAGYCFIEMKDSDSARRTMLNINGKIIPMSKPAATFNLSFANSPSAPYTEYNLFVNNVAREIDDAGLFLVFGERYRSCRGAKVYRNTDGSSKGLGFVRFAGQTDQQRALVEMNKHKVHGKELILKLAQPKYRAPKAIRGAQTSQYDPANYYPQLQSYYNAAASFQQTMDPLQQSLINHHIQQQAVAAAQMQQMPMAGAAMMAMANSQPQTAVMPPRPVIEVEPVTTESAEESNARLISYGEEYAEAIEESRWTPCILLSDTTLTDLVTSIS